METNMSERIPRRALLLVATALAAISAFAISAASASAAGEVVYSNVPNTLAGNYASVGAEAYSYAEFGTQLELSGEKRNKPTVEVVMSAWACQFGTWSAATCETPQENKKFKWPLTLSVYEVGEKNTVGEKIGSITKTFGMPYRPSDNTEHCTEGRWYQASTKECFHGKAFTVKFPAIKVLRLPKHVIFGISYNTSDYGPAPIGKAACSSKSAGCYYDSLNVGLSEPAEELLSAGLNPTEPYVHVQNAGNLGEACGNTAALSGFVASECNAYWEGDQPLFRVSAH
jgi:hypothetical protein